MTEISVPVDMPTNIGEGFAFFRWVRAARSSLTPRAAIVFNNTVLREWRAPHGPRTYGYEPTRLEKDL